MYQNSLGQLACLLSLLAVSLATACGGQTDVDCAGVQGGEATIDRCGRCVGGSTGREPCEEDCAGVLGGNAYTDECDRCVGGDTDKAPCEQDCNDVWGGEAFVDQCGRCVGGDTGREACEPDCAGEFGGDATLDECGRCVGGSTGRMACEPDCNGVPGGQAYVDECGECVGGDTGRAPCGEDCAGEFGGNAFIDACGDCVGGSTSRVPCTTYPDTCTVPGVDGYVEPTGDGRWRVLFARNGVLTGGAFCCPSSAADARASYPDDKLLETSPGCTRRWADNYDPEAIVDGCTCTLSAPDVDPANASLTLHLAGLQQADRRSPYDNLRYGVICDGEPVHAAIYDIETCTEEAPFEWDCPSVDVPLDPEPGSTCWAYVRQYDDGGADSEIAWEFGDASYSGSGWAWGNVE